MSPSYGPEKQKYYRDYHQQPHVKARVRAYRKKRMDDPVVGPRERSKAVVRSLKNKFKRLYGITVEQFNARLSEQGGVCAICRRPESDLGSSGRLRPLSVDHDHVTGAVRGLLCNRCNGMLGYARDSVETLKGAIAYLGGEVDRVQER